MHEAYIVSFANKKKYILKIKRANVAFMAVFEIRLLGAFHKNGVVYWVIAIGFIDNDG